MHNVPLPARVIGGFALAVSALIASNSAVFAAQPVLYSGSGLLKGTWALNFDTGQLNALGSGPGLFLQVESLSERYLVPNSPAMQLRMGSTRPTYYTCSHATLLTRRYRTSRVPVGTWFCFKTAAGRYARYRVDAKSSAGIGVTYTTWQ